MSDTPKHTASATDARLYLEPLWLISFIIAMVAQVTVKTLESGTTSWRSALNSCVVVGRA